MWYASSPTESDGEVQDDKLGHWGKGTRYWGRQECHGGEGSAAQQGFGAVGRRVEEETAASPCLQGSTHG